MFENFLCLIICTNLAPFFPGGVPEENYFLNDRQELFRGNFRGCIEQLTIQENVITDFKHYDSVNVDVCDVW